MNESRTANQGIGTVLKRLALDVLAGWLFLAIFLATGNIFVSTALGVVTGVAQALRMIWRGERVDPMQWMALALVVFLGSATVLTHNPTFVIFKPTIFEGGIALMMLRPGWLLRYTPSFARDLVPRLLFIWGYAWAVAWFALALSNLFVAYHYGLRAWAVYTNFAPLVLWGVCLGLGAVIFPPIVRHVARSRGIALPSRSVAR